MQQIYRIKFLKELCIELSLFKVLITKHLYNLEFEDILKLLNHVLFSNRLIRSRRLNSWMMVIFISITIIVLDNSLLFLEFLHELIILILQLLAIVSKID